MHHHGAFRCDKDSNRKVLDLVRDVMQAQQAAEADLQLMTLNLNEQQQSVSAQHAQQLEASCASLADQKAAAEQTSAAATLRAQEQGTT